MSATHSSSKKKQREPSSAMQTNNSSKRSLLSWYSNSSLLANTVGMWMPTSFRSCKRAFHSHVHHNNKRAFHSHVHHNKPNSEIQSSSSQSHALQLTLFHTSCAEFYVIFLPHAKLGNMLKILLQSLIELRTSRSSHGMKIMKPRILCAGTAFPKSWREAHAESSLDNFRLK